VIGSSIESSKNSRISQRKKRGNKKILRGVTPPWEHVEPVWELRVDEYRVFYDTDETTRQVTVRAIRHKPPHKTTEDIL